MTYIRYSRGSCQRLLSHLLKQIQIIAKLFRQKDCRGTAEVNDTFDALSKFLYGILCYLISDIKLWGKSVRKT